MADSYIPSRNEHTNVIAGVVQGPWTGPPVKQPTPSRVALPDDWWRRDGHGRLWVWCTPELGTAFQWHEAPVPMAEHTKLRATRKLNRFPDRDRITSALDFRMMHGPEVDEALGVHNAFDTTVDAWEAGTEIPSEDDIRRLATLTGFAPEWFYQDAPQLEGVFICGRGRAQGGPR